MALNRDIPARGLLRAAFFVPYIVNIVAIGMTWHDAAGSVRPAW